MAHVLQAISDHAITFEWRGDQLCLYWRADGSKRRLTRNERRRVLQAVEGGLAWRSYHGTRHGRFGTILITVEGQKQLRAALEAVE